MTTPKPKDRSPEEPSRPRLGRGLAALLADTTAPDTRASDAIRDRTMVPVEFLRPNPRNPRRQFGSDDLRDLTDSIRAKGIIQPIVVRSIPNVAGSYEIIAGERRWRAAQAAHLTEVPVAVVEADDREALAFAIIENVQRSDLNAIEEARGYQRLNEEFGTSQAELAALIGKSRSHVANMLRLLRLPDKVVMLVIDGALSAGHARALLSVPDPERVARRIVDEGLTVRAVELLAQQASSADIGRLPSRKSDPDGQALAKAVAAILGLRVSHRTSGDAGELRIRYASRAELASLRQRLGIAGEDERRTD